MGAIGDQLRAALARGDTARYVLRADDPEAAWTWQGECCRILGEQIPLVDALEQGPPPPVPAPAPTRGRAGSYPGHDPAIDAYLGGDWGPHHGIPLRAPSAGRVELYTFPTPLVGLRAGVDHEYMVNHARLFDGWTCMVTPNPEYQSGRYSATQQIMAVFVFWPDVPLRVDNVTLQWLGGGHVRLSSVHQGRVQAGDVMAETWQSGVHFEAAGYTEARAAHWHAICGGSRTLSPNGDLSGLYAIRALGFPDPIPERKPGPTDYEQRDAQGRSLYCAGRPRAQWPATVPIPLDPGN